MIIEGGFEMATVIIVGTIWISLLAISLWFCYRFHRFSCTKTRNLSLKVPLQQNVTMNGAGN
jgi:hypothetical protein